ncbi:hypothetical protein [Streptomyces mirabilis]
MNTSGSLRYRPPSWRPSRRTASGTPPDERTRGFLDASAGNPLLAIDVLDRLARAAARGEPDTVP